MKAKNILTKNGKIIGVDTSSGYISTPIGNLPRYEDLKPLFRDIIDKEYPKEIYIKQFSLYIDPIIKRIDLQKEAYAKEKGIPVILFDILDQQKSELLLLKESYGSIISPDRLPG